MGKRLTDKEFKHMQEKEISQAEDRISDILDDVVKPFIGVDIAKSPDQSATIYISGSRKVLICRECLYYDKCGKRNADGLIACFKKPRCSCAKCKLKKECNDANEGVILCPDFVSVIDEWEVNYMR